jgi:hypothetical protein
VRDASVAVTHEQLVDDLRVALDRARHHVAALRARAPEQLLPVRELVARWAARTGEAVPVPVLVWALPGDPFAPPVLEATE